MKNVSMQQLMERLTSFMSHEMLLKCLVAQNDSFDFPHLIFAGVVAIFQIDERSSNFKSNSMLLKALLRQ